MHSFRAPAVPPSGPVPRREIHPLLLSLSIFLPLIFWEGCLWQERPHEPFEQTALHRMLQQIGCDERSAARLDSIGLAKEELPEIEAMKRTGTSDSAIVEILLLDRTRHARFTQGEAVAQWRHAGVSSPRIVDLYRLNALPAWRDDVVEMRDAGISEKAILRLAELRFAQGKSGLSGKDMAAIKSTGFSELGIITLLERGAEAEPAEKIIRLRKAGKSEDEILRTAQ